MEPRLIPVYMVKEFNKTISYYTELNRQIIYSMEDAIKSTHKSCIGTFDKLCNELQKNRKLELKLPGIDTIHEITTFSDKISAIGFIIDRVENSPDYSSKEEEEIKKFFRKYIGLGTFIDDYMRICK